MSSGQPDPNASDPSGHDQPIDLGVIVAHPVPGSGAVGGSATASSPRDPVRDARAAAVEMVADIVAAHRGPKPNSRPVPRWVRSLAWFLDDSIPIGGQRRVGVDGVVSFVPGIGDAAGLVASMVVVLAGIGAGVSLPTVALMLVHVGIDSLIGAVPFLGAVFDMGYKANTRNLRLIERDLADRAGARRSALKVFAYSALALVVGWVLFLVAIVASTYLFVRLLAWLF